jgi:hypothetical protein
MGKQQIANAIRKKVVELADLIGDATKHRLVVSIHENLAANSVHDCIVVDIRDNISY